MSEPHRKGNRISYIILGGQDGLVSVLGLLLGLVAATNSSRIVIAGGLATIFAETLSMTAVAYTSRMAEREHYVAESARESEEMRHVPRQERREVEEIYAAKGFSGKLLDDIVDHITSDKQLWKETMMRDELELLPVAKHDVYGYCAVVGSSTFGGAILPLIPFFFLDVHQALLCSMIISIIALAAVGAYKAYMTLGNPIKSAIQMVIIGIGAAVAGYLIGLVFKP